MAACGDFVFEDDEAARCLLVSVATSAHLASAALLFAGIKPFLASLGRLKRWNAANA